MVSKRRPTAEERDERVVAPIPAEKLVEGVLHAGPHPDDDETDEDEG